MVIARCFFGVMKLNVVALLPTLKQVSTAIKLNEAFIDQYPDATCTLINLGLGSGSATAMLSQIFLGGFLGIVQLNVVALLAALEQLSTVIKLNEALVDEDADTLGALVDPGSCFSTGKRTHGQRAHDGG